MILACVVEVMMLRITPILLALALALPSAAWAGRTFEAEKVARDCTELEVGSLLASGPVAHVVVDDFELLDLHSLLSGRIIDWLHDFEALDLRALLRPKGRQKKAMHGAPEDFPELNLKELLAGF